ncbi:MAG: PhzF family phenazine biosynthesis protein [Pseudomonadales bacterium]
MKIEVAIVEAFVDGERGGNPAGVVLDADRLDREQKLSVAAAVGLSETAFVGRSEIAEHKLDFFTPTRQIAHCGHATVAAFSYLAQAGKVASNDSSKETIDGTRQIAMRGERAFMQQLAPTYSTPEPADFAAILGLNAAQLLGEPWIVNTGNSFLLIEVNSPESLAAVQPDLETIEQLSECYDLIGFYVFTRHSNVPGRDASTRMFAPRYGITEEAATGMAAGPLACLLFDKLGIDSPTLQIEQGYAMIPTSPSCITVELALENGEIQSLLAGGLARVAEVRTVEI